MDSLVIPTRVQRRRTKGSTMGDATYVGRGTKWGSPFKLGSRQGLARVPAALNEPKSWEYESRSSTAGTDHDFFHPDGHVTRCEVRYLTAAESVACYRSAILGTGWPVKAYPSRHGLPTLEDIREELAGKTLACWCSTDMACHGDFLLAIANGWDLPEWLTKIVEKH